MVYAPIPLDHLTIEDLRDIQITHSVSKRSQGRRFTATFTVDGFERCIDNVVFHKLFLKTRKLAKEATENQDSAGLKLIKSFTLKLQTAQSEASKDYTSQGCLYKVITAFHQFFGTTPWLSSHENRVEALLDKIDRKIAKCKLQKTQKPLSPEWLDCLENQPSQGKKVDIQEQSQIFQTTICPMFPGENQTAKFVERNHLIEKEINTFAKHAHTIIDTSVNKLLSDFLVNKMGSGSLEEQALYQNMTVEDFVKRLLEKRSLSFSHSGVAYLRDRTSADKDTPLELKNYLSYDEMQVSAFLITATPTHFINEGESDNMGNRLKEGVCERQGIYYGISGARLGKQDFMEEELVYVRPDRQVKNFYTWLSFFGSFTPFFMLEHEDPVEGDFYKISDDCYLDKVAYKKIMEVRISAFLKDADNQARERGKKAYLHVIPLGLEFSPFIPSLPAPLRLTLGAIQREIYKEQLELHQFNHIDTLNFSRFPGVEAPIEEEPIGTIKVLSSFRDTAKKLDDDNLLLCAQYEANPGSLPGNGYWKNRLFGEGAVPALCSTIAELANPYINENITNLYIYK